MKQHIIILCCLALVGWAISSCSDDDNTQKYMNNISENFQKLKGDYSGSLTMPDNTAQTLRFSIVDEGTSSVQTDVKVPTFPLDGILSKLYPNDYQYVNIDSRDSYVAPIDSVGTQINFMNFKTDDDRTAQLKFSYTHNNQNHSGWAQISTTGMYFTATGLLTISFNVIDLVVDNQDMTRLLPINYTLDAEKQTSN